MSQINKPVGAFELHVDLLDIVFAYVKVEDGIHVKPAEWL